VPTRFVIVHDEWGVFVGSHAGSAVWTNINPAGQAQAVTFDSPHACSVYLRTWEPSPPMGLRAVPVQVGDGDPHATVEQCVEAGLVAWDPGFRLAAGTVHGELAIIIEMVDRLINDAAATGDDSCAMRVSVLCELLSSAAGERGRAIRFRLDGAIDEAMACESASGDDIDRAASVLDDRKWE